MEKRVYPAVKAIIQKDEKILFLEQHIGDRVFWDLPGGKVDHGESPYETLRREVMEEVCLNVLSHTPVGMHWFFRLKDGHEVVCTAFVCEVENYDIDITKNPADEEIKGFRWLSKEEFLRPEFKTSDESLKILINEL